MSGDDPKPAVKGGDSPARQEAERALASFAADCTACGGCLDACPVLSEGRHGPDEIARAVLSGRGLAGEVMDTVLGCHLCGLCSQACPSGLGPGEMIAAARRLLVERGELDLEGYRLMRVDRDQHFFALYRKRFGIDYADLERIGRDVFLPGCTLSSFAPELTRAAHGWLQGQGWDVGMTTQCCGLPLSMLGLSGNSEAVIDALQARLLAGGASRVIAACPNCSYRLAARFDRIEVVPLYRLLLQAGMKVPGHGRVTVHDSCLDRASGEIGRTVRQLLAGRPIVEMPHHGPDAICCGSGGNIGGKDPGRPGQWADRRIGEFERSRADACVTSCMDCARQLTALRAGQGGDGGGRPFLHILELLFDRRVDHDLVRSRLDDLWSTLK